MTLDEAIEHAKRVARTRDDDQCAADHAQLAEWLRLARGADEAARWYTAKIRELENRSKAFETLISEKEAENAKLRELADAVKEFVEDTHCEECPFRRDCDDNNRIFCANDFSYHAFAAMRELGVEMDR